VSIIVCVYTCYIRHTVYQVAAMQQSNPPKAVLGICEEIERLMTYRPTEWVVKVRTVCVGVLVCWCAAVLVCCVLCLH
jgi:hypothetical protein